MGFPSLPTAFSGESPSELGGATGSSTGRCNGAAPMGAAAGAERAVGADLGETTGARFGPCWGATVTEPALGADMGAATVPGAIGVPCGDGIGRMGVIDGDSRDGRSGPSLGSKQ
jgi:hypothetical protein